VIIFLSEILFTMNNYFILFNYSKYMLSPKNIILYLLIYYPIIIPIIYGVYVSLLPGILLINSLILSPLFQLISLYRLLMSLNLFNQNLNTSLL